MTLVDGLASKATESRSGMSSLQQQQPRQVVVQLLYLQILLRRGDVIWERQEIGQEQENLVRKREDRPISTFTKKRVGFIFFRTYFLTDCLFYEEESPALSKSG